MIKHLYTSDWGDSKYVYINDLPYQELVIEIFTRRYKGNLKFMGLAAECLFDADNTEYLYMDPLGFNIVPNPVNPDSRLVPITRDKFMKIVEEYVRVRDL